MPTPAYMTIEGTHQGSISAGASTQASVGNRYQNGHENQILLQAVDHTVFVPSGANSGHRRHTPLVVTKGIDKSSPLINIALSTGEPLTLCRLEFYRTAAPGAQELFYSMELHDAVIVHAQLVLPNCLDADNAEFTLMEVVHFAYRKITWVHEVCGTTGIDQWNS
ncbi:Hcp family type VI secretion system effector [Pseudomonas sp. LS1212]|uniref:Hcp family type VI secretion system effector n=1 Tax=Pseudomonas sp. LS1212 TaxID=2972478 RepID=UPI00215C72F3|nr:Hcp family type VI secretion system effector [Pseudomonas sp. LS1212]UVJ44006.1 Hcp family type VI secretion system effector [Pseudomonas sp. LS1212]